MSGDDGINVRATAWMTLSMPAMARIDLSHLTDEEFDAVAVGAVGEPLAARLRADSGKTYRPVRVDDESWPSEHEADCASRSGGDCSCPMGNL